MSPLASPAGPTLQHEMLEANQPLDEEELRAFCDAARAEFLRIHG